MNDDTEMLLASPDAAGDEAAEAAFEKLMGATAVQEASGASQEPTEGDGAPDEGKSAEEAGKAPTGTPDGSTPTVAGDDAVVEITEGDKTRRVPVKDLKALLAREAEIAARDTTTSEALTRANQEGEKAVAILANLVKGAEAEWAKYAGIDFGMMAVQFQSNPEAYKQLRKDAQEAWQRLSFLKQEGNAFAGQVQQNRLAAHQQAMKDCDAALAKDPDPIVKGWNAEMRAEAAAYAVSQGMTKENAESLAMPAALKMIRKAALYDKGQKAVETAVKPVATSAPAKVLKPGAQEGRAPTTAEAKLAEAKSRLKQSGSTEDAEAAFLALL